MPPGNYRIQFVVDGHVSLFYGGTTTLGAAARVTSGAKDINIMLPRGGTVMGRITAADTSASLEHAAVTLYDIRDRVVATQLTTFDGSYRFKGALPTGAYRIGVTPGQRDDGTPYFTGYQAVFSGGASSLAQAQLISLVTPKTIRVDLAMPMTQAPSPTDSPTPVPPTPTSPVQPGEHLVHLPVIMR